MSEFEEQAHPSYLLDVALGSFKGRPLLRILVPALQQQPVDARRTFVGAGQAFAVLQAGKDVLTGEAEPRLSAHGEHLPQSDAEHPRV